MSTFFPIYVQVMSNFYVKAFFLTVLFCTVHGDEINNMGLKYLYRNSRNCHHRIYSNFEPFYRKSILENTVYLVFIILLGILFALMFLGFIKAILGCFGSRKLGEYGMHMLIDLPKPLDEYQEKELQGRPVCYDIAGWPVHPDTGERTVRMLPTKTEFCLNIIFFLAYPLALMLQLCSICCCIRDYKGEDDTCFKEVNLIKCREGPFKRDRKSGPQVDVYKDNDMREAKDTSYVINLMKQSQMSLEKLNRSGEVER